MGLEPKNLIIIAPTSPTTAKRDGWFVRSTRSLIGRAFVILYSPERRQSLAIPVSSRLVSSALRGPLRSSLCKTSKPSGFNSSPELLILPPREKVVEILVRAVIE